MAEWYYQKGGEQFGAISGSELKSLAEAGRLLPTDLVRKAGKTEWRPAREVKGLYTDSPVAANRAETNKSLAAEALPRPASSPRTRPSGGFQGPISVLLFMTSLASIFVGAASIAAFWTPFAGWTILLAMVALVAGTLMLVIDWFRDVPRFSVSVMGVATGTLALCLAFVHQGGLDFRRYVPIVITREAPKEEEAVRDAPPEATRELLGQTLQDVPEPSSDHGDRSATSGPMSLAARESTVLASDCTAPAGAISSTSSALSGVIVTPVTLEGLPKVESVSLCKPGKGVTFGTVQSTHTLGRVMLAPPGTYDLWYTTHDTGTVLILKDLEVPARRKLTVQSDRVVSAIVVNDLGLGVKAQRASVVSPGGDAIFNTIARSHAGFGQPILVAPDKEYDVVVTPEGGKDVVVAEKVRPKPGEIVVVGGDAGTGNLKTTP
jgi:hypothetical protein